MVSAELRQDIETAKTHGWYCSLKEVNGVRYWQLTYLPKTAVEPQNQTSSTRTEAITAAIAHHTAAGTSAHALRVLRDLYAAVPSHESVFRVSKTALVSPPWHIENET